MASAKPPSQSRILKSYGLSISAVGSAPGIVVGSVLLAIIVHWLPNLGVPLHSDTAFIFLLQAASPDDEALTSAIPYGLRAISAYPQNPIEGAIDLARQVDRYNLLNFLQFWFTARWAGDNADIWRLVPIVFMGASVGMFINVARQVRVYMPIALILAAWLLLNPLDTWVNYNKSESMGIFFMMAALWAALHSGARKWVVISAAFMAAAVLTKEPFLAAWPLVGGLAAYRTLILERSTITLRSLSEAVPHAVGVIFVVGVFAAISLTGPNEAGYSTGNSAGASLSAVDFFRTYAENMFLVPTSELAAPLVATLLVVALLIVASRRVQSRLAVGNAETILIATLLIGIALHGAIHFATDREVVGRYVIPANFEMALLAGLVISPVTRITLNNRNYVLASLAGLVLIGVIVTAGERYLASAALGVVFAVAVFWWLRNERRRAAQVAIIAAIGLWAALPLVDNALSAAGHNRVNQEAWQNFIVTVVREVPDRALITLSIDDPNMLEIAQSLQAHTLLEGRTDLRYRLEVTDTERLKLASEYVRRLIDEFNADTDDTGDGISRNHIRIVVDRNGQRNFVSDDGDLGLGRLGTSLNDRYGTDRPAFLHFEIIPDTE